jgi:hypothetical protein
MLKKLFATGILMAFLGGVGLAADYNGVITKIDTEKKTINAKVKVGKKTVKKDFTYDDKDTTFTGTVGKKGKKGTKGTKKALSPETISAALGSKRAKKRGFAVKFTTDGDSTKLTAIEVAKKKSKKKKKKATSEE